MGLDFKDLLLIFLIVLLIFGGKKIPEVARGLGKGIREFRKAKDGICDDDDEAKPARVSAPQGKALADTASTSPNLQAPAPPPSAVEPAAKGQGGNQA